MSGRVAKVLSTTARAVTGCGSRNERATARST